MMDEIHPTILKEFPELDEQQKEAIALTKGPLLIIAGPGSGKTFVLILRTLNILLKGLAKPSEIVLCTFTDKSAFELRDRLSNYAKKVGYDESLHELHVGTIHGISNNFILKNRHFTPLGNNYDVLDDLTQLLLIFDNFETIIGSNAEVYFGKWTTKWTAIEGVVRYFNKITEELIEPELLIKSNNDFIKSIGEAYLRYEQCLIEFNKTDFAHIQKYFLDILNHKEIGEKLTSQIKYVMVDEYQDTNYVQEQLLFKLVSKTDNLCVVGDEDQSLYRFRGATVRNILEFDKHYPKCSKANLTINYRSHKDIIDKYNKFMASWNWKSEQTGKKYRFDKKIIPNPKGNFPEYPSVFAVWGSSKSDEARRFAEIVFFLKENRIIEDYSQIALLLHSVRFDNSSHYIDALQEKGIPAFCPRQRAFFENPEIRHIVGCFSIILEHYGENRGEMKGALKALTDYVDEQIKDLGINFAGNHPLALELQNAVKEIESIKKGGALDKRLADYLYQFISVEPFRAYVNDENKARNLAIFSQLLNVFQNYYHYTVITSKNFKYLRLHFFNSFLRLLYDGGINEYEDPDMPFPKGYVQVMTIHQSKGLEFPVVVVGSLDKKLSSPKEVDKVLGSFFHRQLFEPEDMITGFDRMRLHYVAFSRAEKILVLTTTEKPMPYFNPICQGLDQWPHVRQDLLKALFFKIKNRMIPKKSFSFTSDLSTYETCPRQYQFFREYDFTPSRSAEVFFGSLVHQTIEEIHRYVLSGKLKELNENKIKGLFEFNFKQLLNSGMRPIGQKQKELAFKQVMNYFNQNKEEMKRVIETEVDVSIEKDEYILMGKIDLLLGGDGKLEILDFKSMKKPVEDKELIEAYHKQLCIYGHIIEQRYKKKPEKLIIYWTSEEKKEDAIMVFPYEHKLVSQAANQFDKVVSKILNRDYNIIKVPEKKYCKECDLKKYCVNVGTIKGG